jgi:predicted nucleic acid-binding protein
METWVWIVIAAVIVLVALGIWFGTQASRRRALQERFGPEYERAVSETGKRSAAESELLEREKRREQLEISPLDPEARERYAASWQEVQASFVDAPSRAISEADRLVAEVMRERGYPVEVRAGRQPSGPGAGPGTGPARGQARTQDGPAAPQLGTGGRPDRSRSRLRRPGEASRANAQVTPTRA